MWASSCKYQVWMSAVEPVVHHTPSAERIEIPHVHEATQAFMRFVKMWDVRHARCVMNDEDGLSPVTVRRVRRIIFNSYDAAKAIEDFKNVILAPQEGDDPEHPRTLGNTRVVVYVDDALALHITATLMIERSDAFPAYHDCGLIDNDVLATHLGGINVEVRVDRRELRVGFNSHHKFDENGNVVSTSSYDLVSSADYQRAWLELQEDFSRGAPPAT